MTLRTQRTQKSTDEIRKLVRIANLDFEKIQNEALNAYLPRIFNLCPFSKDVCTSKQCIDCPIFIGTFKK
jgi:hypothetical protein